LGAGGETLNKTREGEKLREEEAFKRIAEGDPQPPEKNPPIIAE